MDDALLVGVVHGVAHVREQREARAHVERVLLREAHEVDAVDELHGEEGLLPAAEVGDARLVDVGDARVLQAAEDLGLAAQAAHALRRQRERVHDLQRDAAARGRLLGLVHEPHAALSDLR